MKLDYRYSQFADEFYQLEPLIGMVIAEKVDEDGGPSYPVITGDYRSEARWQSVPVRPGTPLTVPQHLFAKLDTSVVDEELKRLEES
jgi:methionyl-tRNA synthetase